MLMQSRGGSEMFLLFSYVAFLCFITHVIIQWILTKLTGPYGKKSTVEEPNGKSIEALEINKTENGVKEKIEDGFSEIDLTR